MEKTPVCEERLTGTIRKIRHQNAKSGFFIAILALDSSNNIVVLGEHPALFVGEKMRCNGVWVENEKFGRQFRAREVEMLAPSGKEGLTRFLVSAGIKGIGKTTAARIVKAFGDRLPEIINEKPKLLLDVPGMNAKKVESLLAAWREREDQRNAFVFLFEVGIGNAMASKIYRTYGKETVAKVRHDPYSLAREIRGFGFLMGDSVARRVGIEETSPKRLNAGLLHVLDELAVSGHCGANHDAIVERMRDLLQVDEDIILKAIEESAGLGLVVIDSQSSRFTEPMIWHAGLSSREKAIADHLKRLVGRKPAWGEINAQEAVEAIAGRTGFAFGRDQKSALAMALTHSVSVITGNPGTGKTSIVRYLIEELERLEMRILLAAPTGKASRRLSESTLRPASTIHRMLESAGEEGFGRNETNPLDIDVVIVDEASMIDIPLMNSLLRAIRDGTSLIIVGDVDQLPSVGPGQVLHDVISSGTVPMTRLREIFRQAAESRIITNAFRVNNGEMPEVPAQGEASDFYYMEASDAEDAFQKVCDMALQHIPRKFGFDPRTQIQVLCPMKSGACGTKAINALLQQEIGAGNDFVERFGERFGIGDKVIQTSNNYRTKIFNGDVGYITAIDREESKVAISFDSGLVVYEFDDLDQIQLAYAMTIHRSQGSEFPAVVIPVLTSHYVMLQRNLVYTGITRGKQLVVMIGQKRALALAARNNTAGQRASRLSDFLR
jgi:exodeoxyribonuclease V alpha subunit